MSPELIAVLITAVIQLAGLVALGWMMRSRRVQMDAKDAAIFQQTRRVEDVLREMRESLRADSR